VADPSVATTIEANIAAPLPDAGERLGGDDHPLHLVGALEDLGELAVR
jgi:hypothetical protein